MKSKKCTRCHKILSISCFTTRRDRNSVVSACKECSKLIANSYNNKKKKLFIVENIDGEIWKDIIGYEGYYMVSNKGRIKSLSRLNDRGFQIQSKILKPVFNKLGTSNVKLNKKSNKSSKYTHLLVATHFVDNPKNKKEVKFIDDDKSNVNSENLSWCDRKDNFTDFKKDMSYYGKCNRDPLLRFKVALRHRIREAVGKKKYKKKHQTEKMLGISYEGLIVYIERQFKKGMSWENRGYHGWHIDHKIPLSSAKTEEELVMLCHYTNLQPLWAKDNLIKSNKILPFQTHLTL